MYRTISLKINTAEERHQMLWDVLTAFTTAYNECVSYGWENKTASMRKIHDATYYRLRELTHLPADVLIQARQKACETLKSIFRIAKNGKEVSKPNSKLCPIRYNYQSSKIDFIKGIVSLSTLKGGIRIPIQISPFHKQYINGKYCSCDLIYRKGQWFLNVVLEFSTPESQYAYDCVGVDLGVNRLAVTSQKKFYSSKHLHSLVGKHQRLRSDLQSKRSKSARKKLKKISGYWQGLKRNVNHIISKKIVDACPQGSCIALEDLTGIRERTKHRKKQKSRFHSWAFKQLQDFIRYKAEAKGIPVIFVNPKDTSRTCCRCGHCSRSNRKCQSVFICESCNLNINADLLASFNLRLQDISLLPSLPSTNAMMGTPQSAVKLTASAVSC